MKTAPARRAGTSDGRGASGNSYGRSADGADSRLVTMSVESDVMPSKRKSASVLSPPEGRREGY